MCYTLQAAPCESIEQLSPLLGHWQAANKELSQSNNIIEEIWRKVSDKTLEGEGRIVNNGNVSTTEWMRLVNMGNEVFYIAKPKQNERPVAFKLTECTEQRFVFVNKEHDFPKRIEYQLKSSNKLLVSVTGDDDGFSIELIKQ